MGPRFYPDWISAKILVPPCIRHGVVGKGALILNYVDEVSALIPELRRHFFVIERRGWNGINRGAAADIKLVEDLTTLSEARRRFPEAVLLDIGPADFVDHEVFRPLAGSCDFDVIQISCWTPRKRIELLIHAAARLPAMKFVHLGHFERGGTEAEHAYRTHCLRLAAKIAPNIEFPFGALPSNDCMPRDKRVINEWINRARLAVLTTIPEGINRFKMECMAADRPVLVPMDAGPTTQKHINSQTGALYPPTAGHLAKAIREIMETRDRFSPRHYLLDHTGRNRAVEKLKRALEELCLRTGQPFRYDQIIWDGRNESLVWGEAALAEIRRAIAEVSTPGI